jgi:O-antigen/teichoic acid export membrane protein
MVGLIYFIFLAHAFSDPLEQWQMGAFALLSFVLVLAQTFGTFALSSAAVKYIAQYVGENALDKAKAVVARILQISLLVSVVAFVALFAPAEWLSTMLFGTAGNALLIRLLALCSIFAILYLEGASFLQGLQRMRDFAIAGLAYTFISTTIGIFLLLSGWRLLAVVIGWTVGYAVASIACLVLTAKYLGLFGKPHPIKPLVNFSLPIYVSGCIGYFVGWVDQLLLVSYMGSLYGATEAQRILGIYNVAIRASVVPTLFSAAIITVLFPLLASLYTQQGQSSLQDAFRVSVRYSMLIGFPLIVGLATLAYPIIILFGGWQYAEAVVPLVIVSISALFGTLGVAIGPILYTLERTKIASVLSFVSVVLSFVLSYFALAFLNLGMIGTAWGRTIAAVASLLLGLYILKRYVPISIDREALWKGLAACGFMAAIIFALDLVRRFFTSSPYQFLVFDLYLLPIYIVVGGAAYFFSLVLLRGIRKGDVELLHEYVPSKLKPVVALLERLAVAK